MDRNIGQIFRWVVALERLQSFTSQLDFLLVPLLLFNEANEEDHRILVENPHSGAAQYLQAGLIVSHLQQSAFDELCSTANER